MSIPTCNTAMLGHLSSTDQRLFVEFGFGQPQPIPFRCVHHAFESHAIAQPSSIAVEHLDTTITYGELERQANCLATRLRALGVCPGSRICLLMERSVVMVVGILAILKAGGAYVPLDGGIVTQSTLEYVIDDSRASAILTLEKYLHRVSSMSCPVIALDNEICPLPTSHCTKPEDLSSPDNSAYIIYTSGTTGKPKGVDVMHSNVTNLLSASPGNLGMCPGIRVSQLMNISFDMAAWEILGSLCNGSTLCIRGKTSKEWRALLKTVDVVIATPSMMTPHDPTDYPNIKVVATAGEACPQALADSWAKSAQYYNCCGPTEITIVNTAHSYMPGSILSIGAPTPNNNVYVLDEDMKALPIGQAGIMWAGGGGISRGYLNLPGKTAERYKLDPFANDGSMMFNTGDLGRWLSDGKLEHLGRIDDQVKVKGFRVELDGVAVAMETCEGVKSATALLIDSELWGFYTPATVDIESVKAATAKVQPYYAVPTHMLALDSLPLTANDKTDKRALRRLALPGGRPIVDSQPAKCIEVAPRERDVVSSEENTQVEIVHSKSEAKLWMDMVPILAAPPPVYQHNFQTYDDSKHHTTLTVSSSSITSPTMGSSTEVSSSVEKGYAWTGFEDEVLPEKTNGKLLRNLRHQVFTLYRRLFGIVFIINMAVFIASLVRGEPNAQQLGQVVVANVFCAILMRQDYVINIFFNVFCSVPSSWPMFIRRVCARVYTIGGIHSGCAVSAFVWLILFTVQATRELVLSQQTSIATVVVTYWILLMFCVIIAFAHPKVRSISHNKFEMIHRFLGWTVTALVWCQTILLTNDYRAPGQALGDALLHAPPFWLVILMTVSIVLPWTRLRKVPVRSEVLSKHAVRLHFDYTTPKAGSFTRISDSPLMEWHGFATVHEPGQKGYSLVVSRAGDWTSKQIENPPTKLWVRGAPTFGVMRIVPLFRRIIVVATGSGIGPCTPIILEQRIPMRVLWTAPNVRGTFGDKLVDSILAAAPDTIIYDTRTHGKPDMIKLVFHLVREFDAEAVCVISNQKLTQKIVYGMMSRGIPAFGAIWDS